MRHIHMKVSEKVASSYTPILVSIIDFSHAFRNETPEEFEGKWASIIRDFELYKVQRLTFKYM